ncbi:MAG TPA: cystathionine gamma-synthase [Pyrinomonadaceae bacterium]|jgi:cystathionine beta-lyase/cystathionine gamma-synthase
MFGFSTIAVHAGVEPDPATGAVMTPVYLTSTYAQESPNVHKGFDYSRTINPTRLALERNLAALEGGRFGYAFASGMAAIDATFRLVRAGEHVIVSENVYGGTFRLAQRVLSEYGVEFSFVDTSDPKKVSAALRPNTRMVFVETPTNPLLIITDLQAVSDIAHSVGAMFVGENTFMSPYLQRPFEFGADIVVHSTTKYLNGHSDGLGGIVIVNDEKLAERIAFLQNSAGAILSPFEAWLVLRGVKTLALRMQQHDRSGRAIAAFLDEHPKVQKVHYPGLASHPQHELAKRQQKGFGGIVTFDVGSQERARTVLEALKLCVLAESLGGVETLISHPLTMTHASVPPEMRVRLGITEGLVRISVGVEDAEDIMADLDQALSRLP